MSFSDLLQVGAWVVFAIPGFVFITARSSLRGPRSVQDVELSARIATSVVVSIVFDALYLALAGLILGRHFVANLLGNPESDVARWPIQAGLSMLALGILVPAFVGIALYYRLESNGTGRWPWLRRRDGYRNFPTAWDKAAPALGGRFIRVRLPDGNWVGGWYSGDSFIGTYPHGRDLYIEKQFEMSRSGKFVREQNASAGVWVAITDGHIVEWLEPDRLGAEGRTS